ncbi:MAG: hypothetical protein KF850_00460 [Labilithrix sp.]|nr:hypothetical protein [Labilithrix sp.]
MVRARLSSKSVIPWMTTSGPGGLPVTSVSSRVPWTTSDWRSVLRSGSLASFTSATCGQSAGTEGFSGIEPPRAKTSSPPLPLGGSAGSWKPKGWRGSVASSTSFLATPQTSLRLWKPS